MEAAPSHKASWKEFLRLLAAQSQAIDQLLQQARAKRDAILAREQAAIAAAVAEEARLIDEVRRLEEERIEWVRGWLKARAGGEPPGGAARAASAAQELSTAGQVSLAQIVRSLPEEASRQVRTLADTLKEQLDALDDVNRQNAGLLYHALAYVQTVLGALTGEGDRGTYGRSGSAASGLAAGGRSLVDRRV